MKKMFAQAIAKGKDLKHIFKLEDKNLDENYQVIILPKNEKYDTINDPDWIIFTEENKKALDQAEKEYNNGEVFTIEDLEKEYSHVSN